MSYLTMAWSTVAGCNLTLGLISLAIWLRDPSQRRHLLFAVMASSAACCGIMELLSMKASTSGEYGTLVRWIHVPIFMLLISLVWFVREYFAAGRTWLAILVTGLWTAALALNFLVPVNLTFAELTGLRQETTFWGEDFVIPVGRENPWVILANLGTFLLLIFSVDASVTGWRRGKGWSPVLIGGSITLFILTAAIHTLLVDKGIVRTPYGISLFFMAIVIVMAYQLGSDVLHAAQLQRKTVEEKRRWDALLEGIELLVVAVDRQGIMRYANPYAAAILGYERESLYGLSFEQFYDGNEQEKAVRTFNDALEGRLHSHVELRAKSRDGQLFTIVWFTVVLYDDERRAESVLGIGRNVTELRRESARRKQLQQQIAHFGRLHSMGELAAALAHELNQPLTAILSNAQAAIRFFDSAEPNLSEIREILVEIVADDGRASEVIRRLRSFLRRGELHRETSEVVEIVDSVLGLMQAEARFQSIDLYLGERESVESLQIDRIQIQQILVNAIRNSIDAINEHGQVARWIRADICTDGDELRISLTDSGPGVTADSERNAFEAFYTTKAQGMGLGLSLSKSIAEAHGGRITLQNSPDADGGAIFCLYLPLSPGDRRIG